ncbi:beta strand repeat-containing protein [Nitrosophilus alvini]|uniref:beta strand repeat-containing protein n=1 Tax=Nitrosophilus alvini TaxID=2714855 RepID=UPI00190BB2D0|nr:hypothetical protein [Nitrosophilus alvini]
MVGRKWLASALLAGMVMSPAAFAEVSALSDADLGEVSAQGIQTITNPTDISDQQNNNDAVQLNGISQSGASGMEVINHVNSASNTHQNLVAVDASSAMSVAQANDQYADNVDGSDQTIDNQATVTDQNNNNSAVQLNDDSQTLITADVVSNAANSAKNVGQNIASITDSSAIAISQTNTQVALNSGEDTQTIDNAGETSAQENNNGAVQLNDNAQSPSSTMVLSNSAASAENVAQNILFVDGLTDSIITQTNDQFAQNEKATDQTITNGDYVELQNNNSGSTQLNDNAQANSNGLVISNTADSAKNVAQNMIEASNVNGLNIITQTNTQVAVNGEDLFNEDRQSVSNTLAALQNNNEASVQLNDNAQAGIAGMVVSNSADSAENVGQNLFSITGDVAVNVISSSNDQTAVNYSWWNIDQDVETSSNILQRNNSNSVQLNANAQNGVQALALTNTASSAANVGQNAGLSAEWIGFNYIEQSNTQSASNYGISDQVISNVSFLQITAIQDNLNGSVQLNYGATAQDDVVAMAVANTASSASNVGQNAAAAANLEIGNFIAQSNDQYANNFVDNYQFVGNNGLIAVTVGQDNVNAGVQIENGQNRVAAMSLSNTAASASNVGQNVAAGADLLGLNTILQDNTQVAANSAWSGQLIDNYGLIFNLTIDQQNNNAAVQVNAGQNDFVGMSLANSAASAVNVGQNVGGHAALGQIGGVGQSNDQTAVSYWNDSWQDVYNDSWLFEVTAIQNNNSGSVQANDGQNNVAAMSLANSATSAVNVAQNVGGYASFAQIGIVAQDNTQVAEAWDTGSWQYVENVGFFGLALTALQNNNNGAVQLNEGQRDFEGMSLANSAQSAVNVGQNLAYMSDWIGVNIAVQSNDQTATTVFNGEGQTVINGSLGDAVTLAQSNNNAAVQANGGAQDGAQAMSIANSSASAVNVAQNAAYISSLVQIGAIGQENIQSATAVYDGSGQVVWNYGGDTEFSLAQQNNNGAVQVNGAQSNVNAGSLANSAESAVNVGQNAGYMADIAGLDFVYQNNDQFAETYAGSWQDVYNIEGIGDAFDALQNNNNGAVQLNGAQNDVTGISLANSALSAVNVGQNLLYLDNPLGFSAVDQTNTQVALSDTDAHQYVYNEEAIAQNNNNGAVQVNNAQNNVSAMSVLNSTMSAVNNAMNIAAVNGSAPYGTVLNQTNDQYAENSAHILQTIDNTIVVGGQNNNNGSVQLNNAQVGTSALVLANTAGSAANYGLNMASVSGASGWTINQVATQTAINH